MIDWLMINWWLLDNWLIYVFFMIDWWLINDWLMINGMALSQVWLCPVILDCTSKSLALIALALLCSIVDTYSFLKSFYIACLEYQPKRYI